jgi:hypothetical protein
MASVAEKGINEIPAYHAVFSIVTGIFSKQFGVFHLL